MVGSAVTYSQYCDFVLDSYEHNERWRMGQAAFNVLYDWHQGLADLVLGSVRDPYYDDSRLPKFFQWVEENW